jgi:predicted NBD/HSP70 family sugar kinase
MSRSARVRWTTASELLRLIHREPGLTRRQAGERLALGSGALTETVERLREAELMSERRAPSSGRGRPTTTLAPHERGPLLVVAELRARHWAVSLADLAGRREPVASGPVNEDQPAAVLKKLAQAVASATGDSSGRVQVVVAAVAGTVSGTRVVQLTARGWTDIELAGLTDRVPAPRQVPLLVGNDATLAGIAEARTGAARGAAVALHLLVTEGLGGALLVQGLPVQSAHGRGGEFGHLPFGDQTVICPCGARGCWGASVDGAALARLAGQRTPSDPAAYAQHALRSPDARPLDPGAPTQILARRLGAGIAGLVNAHDPEVVTLGGLAPLIRTAAPDAFAEGYTNGLMLAIRQAPPPVRDGAYGDSGPAQGATSLGIDQLTSPTALAEWAARTAPWGHDDTGRSDTSRASTVGSRRTQPV